MMGLLSGVPQAQQLASQAARMQQLFAGFGQQQQLGGGLFGGVGSFQTSAVQAMRVEEPKKVIATFYSKRKTEITEWLKISI